MGEKVVSYLLRSSIIEWAVVRNKPENLIENLAYCAESDATLSPISSSNILLT